MGLLDIMIFWNQRIEKIGIFLGWSEMSANFLENFQNGFIQKQLDGPLRYYDFWNQRIEIYKKCVFWVDKGC